MTQATHQLPMQSLDPGNVPSQMNSFYGDSMISNVGGERVKVALRVRPMMPHEMSRGDDSIVNVADNQHALLNLKTGSNHCHRSRRASNDDGGAAVSTIYDLSRG